MDDNVEKMLPRRDALKKLGILAAATLTGVGLGATLSHLHTKNNLHPELLQSLPILSEMVTKYRLESAARTSEEIKKDLAYQPSPPYYSTFYYLWSRNPLTNPKDLIDPNDRATDWDYWKDNGRTPPYDFDTTYLPAITANLDPRYGLYDSANKRVIEWQLSQMRRAKIDVPFVSWWGPNHRTDKVFRHIVTNEISRRDSVYPRLRFAIVYEPDLMGDKTSSEIEADLKYLNREYGNKPAMLKIGGKPVFFAYALKNNGLEKVEKIKPIADSLGMHYIAHVFNGYRDHENAADDWMQYAPELRIDEQLPHSVSISPGFRKRSEIRARLPRNANEFRQAVKQMVASNARWKSVISFNEYGEGTEWGEPAKSVTFQNGKMELDPSTPNIGKEIDILAQELPDRAV